MAQLHINLGHRPRSRSKIETPGWMITYGDMITLLLAFFIILFTTATIDGHEIRIILSAFPGFGNLGGGNTLEEGVLPELGNTIFALPSNIRDRQLDSAQNQILGTLQNNNVTIREEARGLVVSLAADVYYKPASADINITTARELLQTIALLLQDEGLQNRKFRIEGHTDSTPPDPASDWDSNWDLAAARSINILRYLVDYGASEQQFQILGLADTRPIADNNTVQGRAANRRVDIVILNEGHE